MARRGDARVRPAVELAPVMRRALSLASLLLLGGCRHDPSSTEGVTCTVQPDDTFCGAYASAYCEAHLRCCVDPDEPTDRYPSLDDCLRATTCLCVAGREGAAFEAGEVTLDDAAAARVLDAIRTGSAACDALPPAQIAPELAYVGTLPVGADCSPTGTDYSRLFSCAPGAQCYVTDFGDETTPPSAECRAYRQLGQTCDTAGDDCIDGAYCAPGATVDDPGTCAAKLAAGASCTTDAECESDYCDDTAGNTCAPLLPNDTWCADGAVEI